MTKPFEPTVITKAAQRELDFFFSKEDPPSALVREFGIFQIGNPKERLHALQEIIKRTVLDEELDHG